MKIHNNFRKLFPTTAEYYDIASKSDINESVQKLIEFKEKYGIFIPGSDMIGKYIKFDYFHDEDTKTTYVYRVRGLYEPKEITSRFFINVDIFSKSSDNKQWHFQSDCIQDIDWLLNRNIKLFSKDKYDDMFIKEIGKDYLKSLGNKVYDVIGYAQPMPGKLFNIFGVQQKSLEPEFQEVIEENFDDLIVK